jgi:hypothetical protein
MNWTDSINDALRTFCIANTVFSIIITTYILTWYAYFAWRGDKERKWLGRHITTISLAYLALEVWAVMRLIYNHRIHTIWLIFLSAIFLLSDYSLITMALYRKYRDVITERKWKV